jgi:hypothetical protein
MIQHILLPEIKSSSNDINRIICLTILESRQFTETKSSLWTYLVSRVGLSSLELLDATFYTFRPYTTLYYFQRGEHC